MPSAKKGHDFGGKALALRLLLAQALGRVLSGALGRSQIHFRL